MVYSCICSGGGGVSQEESTFRQFRFLYCKWKQIIREMKMMVSYITVSELGHMAPCRLMASHNSCRGIIS